MFEESDFLRWNKEYEKGALLTAILVISMIIARFTFGYILSTNRPLGELGDAFLGFLLSLVLVFIGIGALFITCKVTYEMIQAERAEESMIIMNRALLIIGVFISLFIQFGLGISNKFSYHANEFLLGGILGGSFLYLVCSLRLKEDDDYSRNMRNYHASVANVVLILVATVSLMLLTRTFA